MRNFQKVVMILNLFFNNSNQVNFCLPLPLPLKHFTLITLTIAFISQILDEPLQKKQHNYWKRHLERKKCDDWMIQKISCHYCIYPSLWKYFNGIYRYLDDLTRHEYYHNSISEKLKSQQPGFEHTGMVSYDR